MSLITSTKNWKPTIKLNEIMLMLNNLLQKCNLDLEIEIPDAKSCSDPYQTTFNQCWIKINNSYKLSIIARENNNLIINSIYADTMILYNGPYMEVMDLYKKGGQVCLHRSLDDVRNYTIEILTLYKVLKNL